MNERITPIIASFSIGGIQVDPDQGLARSALAERRLEPRVMDVLCTLAARAGEAVRRETLLRDVWGDVIGRDEALTRAISRLRADLRALGAEGLVETIPKRGYRLVEPVSLLAVDAVGATPHVLPGPGRREQPGAGGLSTPRLLAVGGVAGLLAIVLLWTFWPQAQARPGTAFLHVDETAGDAVAGLAQALDTLNPDRAIFAGQPQAAEFDVVVQPQAVEDRPGLVFIIQDARTGVSLGSEVIETHDRTDQALAGQIIALITLDLHCLADIRALAPREVWTDTQLTAQLLRLCRSSRQLGQIRQLDAITADILAAYPDLPLAQGLHAFTLMGRIEQYMYGQRDSRTLAAQRAALEAVDRTRELDPRAAILEPVALMQGLVGQDRAERERLLQDYPVDGWFALHWQNLRLAILRETGQAAEAIALAEALHARWQDSPMAVLLLALSEVQNGDWQNAIERVDAYTANHHPGRHPMHAIRDMAAVYYAPRALAETGIHDGVPGPIRGCMQAVLEARFSGTALFDAPGGETCQGADTTMLARMLALTGDLDGALSAVEQFDRRATSTSIILFYPEMLELWRHTRMWDVAEDMGLVDYWQASGNRPNLCRRPDMTELCEREIISRVRR
jgi:DNA-binding winged helix-turn-helix (wHTH) protein